MPPAYVTKHKENAKDGYFIDGLSVKACPSFTMVNNAPMSIPGLKSISRYMQYVVSSALQTRAKAMRSNLHTILAGKRNLSEYAR